MNLPSPGPLNLPIGVVPFGVRAAERLSVVEPNVLEQLADLRIEIVALRNMVEVGLDLLANGVDAEMIAKFLTSSGPFNAETGCRCDLHRAA